MRTTTVTTLMFSERCVIIFRYDFILLKLSHYTPWRCLGGERIQLLLILDLGNRWGWVISVTPRPRFSPAERTPPVPIVQEAWWVPEPVWTQRLEEKYFASARDRTPTTRPQTLYWLSYLGSWFYTLPNKKGYTLLGILFLKYNNSIYLYLCICSLFNDAFQ
jgi:hypothetical protein